MVTLLNRLHVLTTEGKIAWAPRGEDAPYSYSFTTGSGSSIIIDSRDDDGRPPFDLLIIGPHGDVVSELLASESGNSIDYELGQLWELAKDVSAGTTQVIDQILGELPRANGDDILF